MNIAPIVFVIDSDVAFAGTVSASASSMQLTVKVFLSADDYVAQFDATIPGCLIVDAHSRTANGEDFREWLFLQTLHPAIIVTAEQSELPIALRAMRQGAVDFLLKSCNAHDLRDAIQLAIAQDQTSRTKVTRQAMICEKFSQLTASEMDVLIYVLHGTMNKNIATSLKISRRAVEDRRAKIMHKIGVESVAELARLAFESGLAIDQLPLLRADLSGHPHRPKGILRNNSAHQQSLE